jgi:LysM repeat protein
MSSGTGNPPDLNPRPRRRRSSDSFRREVALAAFVVAVYAAVFATSLFSLFGGNAPDPLRLTESETPPAATAQVLGVQASTQTPAPAQNTPAAPAAQPTAQPAAQAPQPQPSPAAQPTTPPAATSPPAASVSGQHLVRSGDTLSQLALTYNIDVGALKLINGLDSDLIYAGQSLRVPRPDEASRIGVPSLGEGGAAGD